MADTTGNFQDLVQLSGDTLYLLGEEFGIGNSLASTLTFGMSNSAGILAIVAAPTGNGTVSLPNSGTLLTNINISAGTTSGNLSAVTFANSNGVSFGLNAGTITASAGGAGGGIAIADDNGNTISNSTVQFSNAHGVSFGLNGSTMTGSIATSLTNINWSAGTTSILSSAITFNNGNGVSFGMLNGVAVITASIATSLTNVNISAGTTSNNLSAVTFANSNGVSFGLNASTVTAVYGGFSSWSNGVVHTTYASNSLNLSLQPIVVPYYISVANLFLLASLVASTTNVSGGYSLSAGLYTFNGSGSTATLSMASSSSTAFTFTSGAALSSMSGVGYRQMAVTWNLTPGPYVLAIAMRTINSMSFTFNGLHDPSAVAIGSGQSAFLNSIALPGYSISSVAALPATIGVSNTASYVRTGSSIFNQPWALFQGT